MRRQEGSFQGKEVQDEEEFIRQSGGVRGGGSEERGSQGAGRGGRRSSSNAE